MIALRSASVSAGAFALDDITFEVPSQSFGVVVGPAGSGKTTLLEAIAGVRALKHGSISLNARDVSAEPAERRNIGLVYQHGALFPHRTVRENIQWAGTDSKACLSIIERLAIHALLDTPVVSLSGGERQLVAIARALVRVHQCIASGHAGILLLDEPYSALDPRRRLATRDIVRGYHREWSLTTLQVTHDGADAAKADVAVLLESGRVVQSGSPAHMLEHPARDDVALFFSS